MIPYIHPVLHPEPTIPSPILPGGLPNAVAWMKQQLAAVLDAFSRKQDTLQSGVNIKTINGESLLGDGNLEIAAADAPVKSATVNGGTKVTPDENGNLALSVDTTNPPLYLHYRVVNSAPGLYSRKMVGGTAIYTLENFASISSQINGRVVECWLAYNDDPSHFEPEEETDRYSRFKLTTAATNLLTFDITGQYAGRMYSRRIKIDNNNVVELGARFEVQNATSALTKTNGTVLKEYLAQSVQSSLNKADSAYQKPSEGIPLADMAVDKFPPELVSDLDHEPTEEDAGKTASAKQVFDKLAGKFDKSGGKITGPLIIEGDTLTIGGEGSSFDNQAEFGWLTDGWCRLGKEFSITVQGDRDFTEYGLEKALIDRISGITSQDITDFLNYKGEWKYEEGISLTKGDVYILKISVDTPQFLRAKTTTISTGEASEIDESFDKIYDANEGKTGLERLIDLFGESNSQLVSTIKGEFKVVEYFTDEDGTKHLAYLDNDGKRTSTELTSFAELFALAKMNRVRLYYHAVGDTGRKALYHPHMVDDEASPNPVIRFDATGTLGGKVYTRSIAVTKTSSGGISITPDGLTELAKKSDLAYTLVNVGVDGVLTDRAINVTSASEVSLPTTYSDLVIRATVTGSLPVTVPDGVTKYGDAFPAESGEFLVTITKTGAAEIYVRTLKIEEVA